MLRDLRDWVDAAQGVETKMILETCYLSDEQVATACRLLAEAGIDWAKTSSGQYEGPTLEQVLVMVDTLKDSPTRVKVAGVKFPRPQNAYTFQVDVVVDEGDSTQQGAGPPPTASSSDWGSSLPRTTAQRH